ncbi:hypothetical protein D0Y65_044421 [Glycine soja]|uniref:Uncharacterized protein n=1 Tax=Glycine soja TaxID=3848 RepID=A0A445GLQ5_GLYSO|nr:hypothetical protein D0Y65_044421 [Glycine soja]
MSSLFYCLITSTNLSEFSSLGHTCLQYIIFRCMFFLSVNVFRYIIYQFLILLDTGSLCFTSCISCNTFSSIYGSSKHPFSEFQPLLQPEGCFRLLCFIIFWPWWDFSGRICSLMGIASVVAFVLGARRPCLQN